MRTTVLDGLCADPAIPSRPALTYLGATNYPLNELTFRCSAFNGVNPFKAMRWRVAEVTDPQAPEYDPTSPHRYEIVPAWESGDVDTFASDITIPTGALKVGHAYRARVRLGDTTGRWSDWSDPIQFVAGLPDNAAALAENLQLTELMYDTPDGSDYEFIELHNASDNLALDLDGATFTSGVDFAFPPGTTLSPGGYLLLVKSPDQDAFRAHYGLAGAVPLFGPYSGSLANEGEQITLKAGASGAELLDFKFGTGRGWPLAAQGAGHSLVPFDSARSGQASGALDYPGNWRASSFIGGSPGTADPPLPPALVLNEIAANTLYSDPLHPDYDSDDWIELFNSSDSTMDLKDYYLSDDPQNLRKWGIPDTTLPPHSWIAFDEVTGFHSPITTGFGLDKGGEQVLLSFLPGAAEDRVVDAVQFKAQERDRTLSRYPDGTPFWFSTPPTRNTTNAPGLSDLVINELMYHPVGLGTNDDTKSEYIELLNPTAHAVSLSGTNGSWRLDGGVAFSFPVDTVVPAGGVVLIVNFDPAEVSASAAFRATYDLTNLDVRLLGPYSGKLGNRSDRVAIEKPESYGHSGDSTSWVIVDEIIYGNQTPWPANANGGGFALQRLSPTRSGNDPANWMAASPTPGATTSALADQDSDGMPDSWERQHSLDPQDPADAALDPDGDGMSNLAEFISGTDPRDPSSVLRFDSVTAATGGIA